VVNPSSWYLSLWLKQSRQAQLQTGARTKGEPRDPTAHFGHHSLMQDPMLNA